MIVVKKVFYYGYSFDYMDPDIEIPFNTWTMTGTIYRWGSYWNYEHNININGLESKYFTSNDLTDINPMAEYFYLKHYVVDGKVEGSYVTFNITSEIVRQNSGTKVGTYSLIIGVDEREKEVQTVYLMNKGVLNEAFGEENCHTYNGWYICKLDNSEMYAEVRYDGDGAVFYGPAIGCFGDRYNSQCLDYLH